MGDGYTRLIAQPYNLLDNVEPYQGYTSNNDLDIPDNSNLFDSTSQQEYVDINNIDKLKLMQILQDVFFDLYGTNLPSNKEDDLISELPSTIPNNTEMFELVVINTLRKLKTFEWVDTQLTDEFTSPQQLQKEVEEIVETGETGDIDNSEIDEKLEDDQYIQKQNYEQRIQAVNKIDTELRNKKLNGANYRPQRRSLSEVKNNNISFFDPSSESDIIRYCDAMQRSEDLIFWDLGLDSNQRNSTSVSGGSASSSVSKNKSWFGIISNGNCASNNDLGLPTIDCDNIG